MNLMLIWENTIDKRKTLSPNVFGYLSVHYVVSFDKNRLKKKAFADYKDIRFEIQIRSILQHAWAEIEHDLGYKSEIEVPDEIRRKFSRLAGLLEIADSEFISLRDISKNYALDVETVEKGLGQV
jgi:ppGpp synthetase/RelA/SpoT-type nucleotidyltranferase